MKPTNKTCVCCGFPTLPPESIFEICTLCGWQDDEVQNLEPDMAGGANPESLNEYRAKWETQHHRWDGDARVD
jgi:hypothetical protein